jgi:hypothetical protein
MKLADLEPPTLEQVVVTMVAVTFCSFCFFAMYMMDRKMDHMEEHGCLYLTTKK